MPRSLHLKSLALIYSGFTLAIATAMLCVFLYNQNRQLTKELQQLQASVQNKENVNKNPESQNAQENPPTHTPMTNKKPIVKVDKPGEKAELANRTSQQATSSENSIIENLEQQLAAQKIIQRFTTTSVDNIYKELDADFESQTIDDSWARDYEDKLYELFSTTDSLVNVSLQSVECRSNMCKLTIPASDAEDANNTLEHLSHAVKADNQVNDGDMIANAQIHKNITTVYLSRNKSYSLIK